MRVILCPSLKTFLESRQRHLFSPVHEYLVCVPGSFLLLMWQQERWHGWRGLMLDRCVCSVAQSCLTLCDLCSLPGWSVHGGSQARILEWVSMPSSKGSSQPRVNSGLPHCRQILHCLSHQGSPRTLELVTYPFSRGSFQPRNRTGVSCIAGRFFTI